MPVVCIVSIVMIPVGCFLGATSPTFIMQYCAAHLCNNGPGHQGPPKWSINKGPLSKHFLCVFTAERFLAIFMCVFSLFAVYDILAVVNNFFCFFEVMAK